MRTTKVLLALLLFTGATLASPLPVRIRFPDERSDDDREGRILLPPLEDASPRDLGSIINRANPIALFIPRDPLPLADPDQSLNAWQFYFPPGPPPTSDDNNDQLDTAGSDIFSSATSVPPTSSKDSSSSAVLQETSSKDSTVQEKQDSTSESSESTESPSEESISTVIQTEKDDNNNKQKAKSIEQISTPSPNFQPRFEDGGWEPIAVKF